MSILIFGGAGFIGYHVARHYLSAGETVHIADNLSRSGARANLRALEDCGYAGTSPQFHHVDIRNANDVTSVVKASRPDLVVHEAAQVAVTTSVANPRLDFEINTLGTFNILEAIRTTAREAFVIYASTNKVYGGMEDLRVDESDERYQFRDFAEGVDESRLLDFHSPYACSKGAADQYVHDYHRIFGLRTAVFRQSCIYGTHQYGVEDQGWIAWFTIAHALGRPITVYGNGKQVRDVLWVEDLVQAYDKVWKLNRQGSVYNMGGGADNTLSLLELLKLLKTLSPKSAVVSFDDVRPGDQPVYIANANRARSELDWQPEVTPADGVAKLFEWVDRNRDQVSHVLGFKS